MYGWEEIFVNIEAILLKPAHPQIALFNLHSLKENLVLSKQVHLLIGSINWERSRS